MRIVLDLQGCQTASADRGIGRYSLALAKAIANNAGPHEILLSLNTHFPERLLDLRHAFKGIVPPENIHGFCVPTPVGQLDPVNDWRVGAAELLYEEFLAGLKPDFVHVSSLFEAQADNAVPLAGVLSLSGQSAVTHYDLIPLLLKDQFLINARVQRWYYRKLQTLKRVDLALAISEASRREAIETLDLFPERIVTISGAAAEQFRQVSVSKESQASLQARLRLTRPFVLCVATAEPHKNLEGLLKAFASLDRTILDRYQLVVICVHEDRFAEYRILCGRLGLHRDDVIFIRRVDDDDLVHLYNLAALFVLPSLHEGFGMTALEAMACGAPSIGSNQSSVPEIVGRADALFDPRSIQSISNKLMEALSNEAFRIALREHGLRQAKQFSWDKSAKIALTAMEDAHVNRKKLTVGCGGVISIRPRLAYVGSFCCPRAADIHSRILPNLALLYRIDLITQETEIADPWSKAIFRLRSPAWFEAHASHFDHILYVVSNEDGCAYILDLLDRYPGSLILLDLYLGRLISRAESDGILPAGSFTAALFRSHGYPGLVALAKRGRVACLETFPASFGIIEMAGTIIATSSEIVNQAREWFGISILQNGTEITGSESSDLEWLLVTSINSRLSRLTNELLKLDTDITSPDESDLCDVASCIVRNRQSIYKTLYVDISYLARTDHGSGVHRAVRNLIRELASDSEFELRVQAVRHDGEGFTTANSKVCELLGISAPAPPDEVVELRKGDIFLGLDLTAESLISLKEVLIGIRSRGVKMQFIVYDLLPVLRPEWFPEAINSWFPSWLLTVAQCADRLICISQTVADDLTTWLVQHGPFHGGLPSIGVFHLGADVESEMVNPDSCARAPHVMPFLTARPSFLMVGTIEPRKGHAIVLKAFEQAWHEGIDVNLVIIGSQGWGVEQLVSQLSDHREAGQRLFWLGRVSDAHLKVAYDVASAVIVASLGEGFGLPLVEAARHARPIIASNIPVFREVIGRSSAVVFFEPEDPATLTSALRQFLSERAKFENQAKTGMRWISWAESAEQLKREILRQ